MTQPYPTPQPTGNPAPGDQMVKSSKSTKTSMNRTYSLDAHSIAIIESRAAGQQGSSEALRHIVRRYDEIMARSMPPLAASELELVAEVLEGVTDGTLAALTLDTLVADAARRAERERRDSLELLRVDVADMPYAARVALVDAVERGRLGK